MHPEIVEEACETKLVYLGGTLFGELRHKLLSITPWPQVNIDKIQAARILHHDANLMEMYIEHAASSDLNVSNANIVRNVQTFLSSSDTTTILPANLTMFDADYLPDSKVEPEVVDKNTMFTITESMGSSLGEISFPSVIKDEPNKTVGQVLATHLPSCQLRCGLEHKLQTMLGTHSESIIEPEPSQTMEYSSDETILLTPPRPTFVSQSRQASPVSSQEVTTDQEQLCSQDITAFTTNSTEKAIDSQDITNTDSQDVTNMDDMTDIEDIVSNPPDEMNTSGEPDSFQDCANNESQNGANNSSVCQEVISIYPEDAVTLRDSSNLSEQQLVTSNITPEITIELDNVETLEKSVSSPSVGSFSVINPNSGLTVIEPQYRNSDDNVCDTDNVTTIPDLDSAHEGCHNSWLSASDTLAQDTSIVNMSMEALANDSVQTTSDQRDSSQDVTSQQGTCEQVLQDVAYTSSNLLNC